MKENSDPPLGHTAHSVVPMVLVVSPCLALIAFSVCEIHLDLYSHTLYIASPGRTLGCPEFPDSAPPALFHLTRGTHRWTSASRKEQRSTQPPGAGPWVKGRAQAGGKGVSRGKR